MADASLPPGGIGIGFQTTADQALTLLGSLVAALPGPLLVLDREDRVLLATPAAETLFAVPGGSLPGRDSADLFPAGIEGSPVRARTQRGAPLLVDVSRREMRRDDGERVTLLWLEDLTEQRRSEDDLKRSLMKLERATRAKSEFVASMSHEIRTPMSAVLGMTDILLESDLNQQQRELAERVRRAGSNLMTTLNDILDLAKVEAGRLDLESRSFALRDWLRETLELFQPQAARKGLGLRKEVDPRIPTTVHGDAQRLRQVLINLVGNAVKFTAAGEVRVSVRPGRRSTDLCFTVQDTGVGISPGELERLFEPWAQADDSTASEYGGTGLGLAICRRLVERMGGAIGASSRSGGGAEFRFSVPLLPKRKSGRESISPPAPASRGRRALRRQTP